MKTSWIDAVDYLDARSLLLQGELVAFPTETVYGLGADATDSQAVSKIFKAKGRPQDNPLIVHVADINQAKEWLRDIPPKALELMDYFWPGPLTIILPVEKGRFAPEVTAGLSTVGVRMPDHELARKLIKSVNRPLAAPSANLSGKPSPTRPDHVWHDLSGKIAGIIDGGPTGVGLESTVVELSPQTDKLTILRPGGISKEDLAKRVDHVIYDVSLNDHSHAPKAPGMKYKHYSPKEKVYLVTEDWGLALTKILKESQNIGILANDKIIQQYGDKAVATYSLGQADDVISASHQLFNGLRYFENTRAQVILAETFPRKGIAMAYMNRLEKAAGFKTI